MKKMLSLGLTSVLAVSFLLSGCSSNDQVTDPVSSGSTGETTLSLEEEFGGFEATNESVAFGDPTMLDAFPEDQDVADPVAVEPAISDALNSFSSDTGSGSDAARLKVRYLRITWGLLEGDSTATEVIDWSGSTEVSKGTLVVVKAIRFEANDFIHFPRESRQRVDFTSFTKPHFDGILLAVIDNDSTDQEGTFTFNAGSYSKSLTFSDLDSLELLEPVGDLGHEVSIITRSKEIIAFSGGFVSGHWVKIREDGGEFRGRWINALGTNAGHVRGIWGTNRNGLRVFKGKYISRNGDFRGLIAGEWTPNRDNGGSFRGRWVNRAHDTVGILVGKYRTGRAGDGRGFFHGRYHVTHKDNAEADE